MMFVLSLAALALDARLMMLEGRMEEADDQLDRAQRVLVCGDPPRSQDLSEIYLSTAARHPQRRAHRLPGSSAESTSSQSPSRMVTPS